MSDLSPYLRQPVRFRQCLALPATWRGLAKARDMSDPLKREYERIALALEQGADPGAIPEISEWLGRKTIWPKAIPR